MRPQFSLRLLLLALTAFAIGFPLWYRWPYEEQEVLRSGITAMPRVERTRITTWQRQWGGGRLKHGLESDRLDNRPIMITTFRNGRRHGPFLGYSSGFKGPSRTYMVSPEPTTTGQYVDDLKEGVWIETGDGFQRVSSSWHKGELHGPYIAESSAGPIVKLVFVAGRLTEANGKPAHGRLFTLLFKGAIDDERIANELQKPTSIEFVEQPLRDVILYLQESHGIPITLDPKLNPNADLPITAYYKGLDLCSALTLLGAEHHLGWDYRYGMLWVTTAEDSADWRDPTGVAEINPPPGTSLARSWNETSGAEAIEQPLAVILAKLAERLAIEIDTQQIEPPAIPAPILITANVKGLPFRHVLGQFLYRTQCRCQLAGDKLIILPPDPTIPPFPAPPRRLRPGLPLPARLGRSL